MLESLKIDEQLVAAVIRSTKAGLQMAGVEPVPVGVSAVPARTQELAVVIGLVGRRNGTVTLGLSQRAVLHLANRFMDCENEQADEQVYDAVGEITNIIAGRLKAELSTAEYQITNISCPSIVMGGDYRVYQFRGFKTVSVEFELAEVPTIFFKERIFSTSVALSQS